MRLIGIAAEDRGDAEGRGAVDEPPEAENTLVLLRSQSAVPEEETAKVSAGQAQGFGGLVDGPVCQQSDRERHVTRGRSQQLRIGLPLEHGVDQASGTPTSDDVVEWEFSVAQQVGRSPEDGRHRLGS